MSASSPARWIVVLSLLAGCVAAARAEPAAEGWVSGIVAGFVLVDEDLAGPQGPSSEPTFGVRASGPFNNRFGWSADVLYTEVATQTFARDAETLTGRAGLDVQLQRGGDPRWFASLGGGCMRTEFDNATDFWSYYVSAGIGQRIRLGEESHYRWELRGDRTLADDGLRGQDITQVQFLLSLNWGKHGPSPDGDTDGVVDRRDRCSDTPAGAVVDARGCPRDADGDGVPDGIDRCPETPAGWPIDASGCDADSDADGVPDREDECAATPAGARVDEVGCHSDGDGDGVADGIDRCPRTLKGIEVDETGCFIDRDGDGVYDGLDMDKCPGTPRGAVVDRRGCPLDGDGDGVYDGLDRCTDTPAGARVGPDGC